MHLQIAMAAPSGFSTYQSDFIRKYSTISTNIEHISMKKAREILRGLTWGRLRGPVCGWSYDSRKALPIFFERNKDCFNEESTARETSI